VRVRTHLKCAHVRRYMQADEAQHATNVTAGPVQAKDKVELFRFMCLGICVHVCTYMYIYIHIYMYVYIYIYIYSHLYIYTHTHTQLDQEVLKTRQN
jgi:hypothetical protein